MAVKYDTETYKKHTIVWYKMIDSYLTGDHTLTNITCKDMTIKS